MKFAFYLVVILPNQKLNPVPKRTEKIPKRTNEP